MASCDKGYSVSVIRNVSENPIDGFFISFSFFSSQKVLVNFVLFARKGTIRTALF